MLDQLKSVLHVAQMEYDDAKLEYENALRQQTEHLAEGIKRRQDPNSGFDALQYSMFGKMLSDKVNRLAHELREKKTPLLLAQEQLAAAEKKLAHEVSSKSETVHYKPDRGSDGLPKAETAPIQTFADINGTAVSFAPESAIPSSRELVQNLLAPPEQQEGESASQPRKMNALDMLQMGLDAVGVADPTPIADGANAVLSVARAAFDPAHAGEHLKNAGISAISMVPYFGDIAKLFKYGGKAAKATGAAADAGHAANAAGHAAGGAGGNGGRSRGGMASTILGMFGGGAGGGSGGGSVGGGGIGGTPPGSSGGGDDFKSPVPQAASAFSDALLTFTQKMTPLAIVVGASVYGLKKFVDWLEKVGETSKRMIEENRNLSQWTGQLAYAYARLDRERLQREIEASRDMSGPLSRLTSAQSGLEQSQEDYMRPYKQLSADIQALLTEVANIGTQVIDAIDPINDILKMWYDQEKTDKTSRTAAEAVARMASDRAAQRKL